MAGCKRPAWSVDIRTDDDEVRDRLGGEAHACPNDECQHGDRYPLTTVRIVCRSCQAALVVHGEDAHTSQGTTGHTTHGYGQQPRTMAGLLQRLAGSPILEDRTAVATVVWRESTGPAPSRAV